MRERRIGRAVSVWLLVVSAISAATAYALAPRTQHKFPLADQGARPFVTDNMGVPCRLEIQEAGH
jgi:hypothetical protein